MATVTTLAAVGVMPAFLLGATAVFVRAELGFDQARLGMAVSAAFVASALCSIVGGRLTEHLGIRRSLRVGAAFSVTGLLGVAVLARSWTHLVLALAVAGLANGVLQPATNLALFRGVRTRRGLMFGIKQSGGSVATLVAGVAVPVVALTVGWRWAFAGVAAVGVAAALSVPRRLASAQGPPRRPNARLRDGDAPATPLIVLSVASGLGGAAATTLGAFLVSSAVDSGIAVAYAGWLLAACSVSGIAARLVAGWVTDLHQRGEMMGIAGLLAAGGFGFLLLAVGGPGATVVGGLVAYSCGWGWVGLLMHTVVRLNPNAPAAATGIIQPGTAAGSALGPLVFGVLIERMSFSVAWSAAAAAAWGAAALVLVSRQWLRASRPASGDLEWLP